MKVPRENTEALTHEQKVAIINSFCNLCVEVRISCLTHRILFDDNPNAEQLKKSRLNNFLSHLSTITHEYSLQSVIKLHDPAKDNQGNKNLTFTYILECMGLEESVLTKLRPIYEQMNKLAEAIKPARYKLICHNDLDTILQAEGGLGGFEEDADIAYFTNMQEFVNIVHDHIIGGIFPLDTNFDNDIYNFADRLPMMTEKRHKLPL